MDLNEIEVRKVADLAVSVGVSDDPFVGYNKGYSASVINSLKDNDKFSLYLEILVFRIFVVTYNCQVCNITDSSLKKVHEHIYQILISNEVFKNALKYYFWGTVADFNDDEVLTNFERRLIIPRFKQYYEATGGVRFPIEKHRLENLAYLSAKNMFRQDTRSQIEAQLVNSEHMVFYANQLEWIFANKAPLTKGTSGCLVSIICILIFTFIIYTFTYLRL